jgi:hypothetical protein
MFAEMKCGGIFPVVLVGREFAMKELLSFRVNLYFYDLILLDVSADD